MREYAGTVVLVTHDRYFLDNVTGWILELDRGHGIPHEGNYSTWLDVQQKRLAQESEQEEARVRSLARESAWVKSSPRARQAKSKARIQAYEELLSKSQDARQGMAQIVIPAGPRLGTVVVEATDVVKAYGEQLLFDDMNFRLPPGGIVGVIGPNGAGKTTLFRILTGQETADSGSLRVGDSVVMGYVDQSRDSLKPNASVWEEISGGLDMLELGKRTVPSRAYVSAFNFKGGDQQKKVGQLSGGERNRVHLAKMLKSGANLLLLDEPTNDLDVETLRALENALEDFRGLRDDHQPRSLVPRPHRDPHHGVRRGFARRMVRGQLPGLRSRPEAPSRDRRGDAAPHQVQALRPRLTCNGRLHAGRFTSNGRAGRVNPSPRSRSRWCPRAALRSTCVWRWRSDVKSVRRPPCCCRKPVKLRTLGESEPDPFDLDVGHDRPAIGSLAHAEGGPQRLRIGRGGVDDVGVDDDVVRGALHRAGHAERLPLYLLRRDL